MSRLMIEEDDGSLREPTSEEVGEMIDSDDILNEGGADLLTRWLVKTFAANPAEAKAFLERRGFEVMEVKDKETDSLLGKMQFAIRNPALDAVVGAENNKWKTLDPRGFDFGDMVDIAYDTFISGPLISWATSVGAGSGAVTAPATGPGGPIAGAVVGGAAGAAGAEAVRQSVGGILGVNKDFHPEQVASAGVIGAVLPKVLQVAARFPQALLSLGKKAGAKAALLSKNMAAKVAGVAEGDITQAASSAARTATIRNETAAKPIELLDRMRGTIQQLRDKKNTFPETREMASILEKAKPVKLKGLMDILQRKRVARVAGEPKPGIGAEKVAITSTASMADDIAHSYGFKDANEAALRSVTAKEAGEIVDRIQKQVHWSGAAEEGFLNKTLQDAQHVLNQQIISSIPSKAARLRYKELNGFAGGTKNGLYREGRGVVGKMQAINEIDKRIGEHLEKGSPAEAFLQKVTGEGRTQERRLVEQFDKLFGTNFVEEGTVTRLAMKFTGDAPKITAMGGALDPAKWVLPGGMAALGAKAGAPFGPPGMLAGGAVGTAAGMLAGTPKTMLKAGRIITAAEELGGRAVKGMGQRLRRIEPLQDFIARTSGGALTDPQTVIRSEEELRK